MVYYNFISIIMVNGIILSLKKKKNNGIILVGY